jgi:osmoprotectant transport system permease protein
MKRVAALLLAAAASAWGAATLDVGSKRFTESYILGEIIAQTAREAKEAEVTHRRGLGNTAIVLEALRTGSIDVYADYTGTLALEFLRLDHVPPLAELNARLASLGLAAGIPLGFNNSYALAMRGDAARSLGIAKLSDLGRHPQLRYGLSQEFMGRSDGWPGLQKAYGLESAPARGLDHGIAYEALAAGEVDVIDAYTTDAKIARYGLTLLEDDRRFFPRYDAVLVYRAELPSRLPRTWSRLAALEGRLPENAMRALNARAELEGRDFAEVASEFLHGGKAPGEARGKSFLDALFGADFARLTAQHLLLVFASLFAAVALGVPLGILAAKRRWLEPWVLGASGVLQTIPALALLAALIPLTGRIGPVPAFIALALYALLPIVRNTHAGVAHVPQEMRRAAESLGLAKWTILRHIELPLAMPVMLAGIRISAVINVGTATIAAFIGAGGYGERIVTGLALNDHTLLLAGALPAAALALLIEGLFRIAERHVVSPPLRAG